MPLSSSGRGISRNGMYFGRAAETHRQNEKACILFQRASQPTSPPAYQQTTHQPMYKPTMMSLHYSQPTKRTEARLEQETI